MVWLVTVLSRLQKFRKGTTSSKGSYHFDPSIEIQFDHADPGSFTRDGVPTPVMPDFTNLKAQWATLTPSGVDSAAYAATMKTTPPACPAFTADGWNVDANAPLPTMGAEGVTPGMPSGVPTGSITVTINTSHANSAPGASTSHTYPSTGNPSSTTSEGASAATSEGAAGKTSSNPLSIGEVGVTGMIVALIAVGAGVTFLL
jgi:1,3-beta-glucanosyltransferase GAS1